MTCKLIVCNVQCIAVTAEYLCKMLLTFLLHQLMCILCVCVFFYLIHINFGFFKHINVCVCVCVCVCYWVVFLTLSNFSIWVRFSYDY